MKGEVVYLTFMYFVMLLVYKVASPSYSFEWQMFSAVVGGWIYLGIKKLFRR